MGNCDQCGDGKQPNDYNTECVLCSADYVGVNGYCDIDCTQSDKISNEIHTECIEEEEFYESGEANAGATAAGIVIGLLSLFCGGGCVVSYKKKCCCWKEDEVTRETVFVLGRYEMTRRVS